jgi:MFS family permease
VYFVVFYSSYREPPEYPHGQALRYGGERLLFLMRRRKVIGLVTGFFGYNYCFNFLVLWLPTYFASLKLDAMHSILYSTIPWVFATATDLLIGGLWVDHLIRRGYEETKVRSGVLIGGTVVGLAIAGAMFTTNSAVAVTWISISLGGLCAAAPVGWSIPSLIAPRSSVGKVGGILNTGNQISGIVAPIVTGYVVGITHSFLYAFGVAALMLVAGIVAYVFLLGRIEPFGGEGAASAG